MTITDPQIRLSALPSLVRQAAVAGTFYPAEKAELSDTVANLLNAVEQHSSTPKAIITPHAGYIYSGSTAAKAYASLGSIRDVIKRVILLGPAHRMYVKGLALSSAHSFDTPLGSVKIDRQAASSIKHLAQVSVVDQAHEQEHSLEVQLPFLQKCLTQFELLPLVVGDASAQEVAEVLSILWGSDETLIVISSDLSHYHDYASSQRIDAATSMAIENMNFEQLDPQQACGYRPIQGLLTIAREREMQIERLGLCNSGDTAGSQDRVVGYGAWSLSENQVLNQKNRGILVELARKSIAQGFTTQQALKINIKQYPESLTMSRATFVTLKIKGQLRGCIGTTEAVQPLVSSVADSAFKAAFRDPRFNTLSEEEFRNTELSISVLTPPTTIPFKNEAELLNSLQPGIDGLTIKLGARKATFLPSVWETLPDSRNFLAQLKLKAGIKSNEELEQAWRYAADSFS